MKNLFIIFFAILLCVNSFAQKKDKFDAYKNIGPASRYLSFELTLNPVPEYLANWELNFSGEVTRCINMTLSYQQYGNWRELVTGADCLLLKAEFPKIKTGLDLRAGAKIGNDLKTLSAIIYLKEEIRLFSWKSGKVEYFSCSTKTSSINFVLYENLCRNSRKNKKLYPELRTGINFVF